MTLRSILTGAFRAAGRCGREGAYEHPSFKPNEVSARGRASTRSVAVRAVKYPARRGASHRALFLIPEPAEGNDPGQSVTGGALSPSMVTKQPGESEAGPTGQASMCASRKAVLHTPADPDAVRVHAVTSVCMSRRHQFQRCLQNEDAFSSRGGVEEGSRQSAPRGFGLQQGVTTPDTAGTAKVCVSHAYPSAAKRWDVGNVAKSQARTTRMHGARHHVPREAFTTITAGTKWRGPFPQGEPIEADGSCWDNLPPAFTARAA